MAMRKTLVIALLVASVTPAAAQNGSRASNSSNSSAGRRVGWALVGAAAGFGLGAWYGLHKFDDAVNSDRKVWTSAIVGAVVGGVTVALVSRNIRGGYVTPARGPLAPPNGDLRLPTGCGAFGIEPCNSRAIDELLHHRRDTGSGRPHRMAVAFQNDVAPVAKGTNDFFAEPWRGDGVKIAGEK